MVKELMVSLNGKTKMHTKMHEDKAMPVILNVWFTVGVNYHRQF